MERGILVGYKNGIAVKTQKPYCRVAFIMDYKRRELADGAVGKKVVEEYLPDYLMGTLRPDSVGKEFDLEYEASYGRAYLVDVIAVEAAPAPSETGNEATPDAAASDADKGKK